MQKQYILKVYQN